MIEPAKLERGYPTITWREQQWPIPPLSGKMMQELWEKLHRLSTVLTEQMTAGTELTEDDIAARGKRAIDRMLSLKQEQFRDLLDVVYVGLTRAHPDLTREEFDDVPAPALEMLLAFYVVLRQSNIMGSASFGKEKAAA